MRPLCFVLMPFGIKGNADVEIRFDDVYEQVIRPAADAAGLECVRADEEQVGGIIHKPMFERLLLCEYAIADLTLGNPNVFYELGVRHAARPWSTVITYAHGVRLPFDLTPLRGLPYRLGTDGAPLDPELHAGRLAASLRAARSRTTDSPLFQLLPQLAPTDLQVLDAEVFRDRVAAVARLRSRLRVAGRDASPAAIAAVRKDLGDLESLDSSVALELLRAYQAVGDHAAIIEVVDALASTLARLPRIQEMYAFALNRVGRDRDAEQVLVDVIREKGPSSEAYGLLGRVYRDRWLKAVSAGQRARAAGLLDKAVDTYVAGFRQDWRQHYPGINAVELMFLKEPPDPRRHELLPVVRFSAKEATLSCKADYWDHATLAEAAALAGDGEGALDACRSALATDPLPWQARTTLDSFQRLRAAGRPESPPPAWWWQVETELAQIALADGSGHPGGGTTAATSGGDDG